VSNFKVTDRADLAAAERWLNERQDQSEETSA
jgi:hypothetical protein